MELTKKVNVFNKEKRKIICIANEHDYIGDGSIIHEKDLEVGKEYTFLWGESRAIGMVVHLAEARDKHGYGYQSYLFEEIKPYDKEILKEAYREWLIKELDKGMQSAKEGKYVSWKQLKKHFRLINKKKDRKMKRLKRKQKKIT